MIPPAILNRLRGAALGAAVGDALGMPLEFGPRRPLTGLVLSMQPGRLPAGSFTDDTETALALAESLLAVQPLDGDDLARRFVSWYHTNPPDMGLHTASVLGRIARGQPWQQAAEEVQRRNPQSAANGSVMRCWPAALAFWNDPARLAQTSALQSRVTHMHAECTAGCVFVNHMIAALAVGNSPHQALQAALAEVDLPHGLRDMIEDAPGLERQSLENSGWVRHTLQSAVWGLLSTDSFEEAVVQVANLGNDADTAASVAGALAGAAYGLEAVPSTWREQLHGEYPPASGQVWREPQLVQLADRLAALSSSSGK